MKEYRAIVLIIDDSQLYRKFLKALLTNTLGVEVVEAQDPKVAFDYLRVNIPDLIILDMELPLMDGYQILKHIRNNSRTKNVAVIPCTELKQEHLILNLLKLGISDYIDKKLPPKEIAHRISKVLDKILGEENETVSDQIKGELQDFGKDDSPEINDTNNDKK